MPYCALRNTTSFVKKEKMHVLIQEMKVHMQSRTGTRNLLSTIRHTCYRRSGSTESLGPMLPEVLLQLRDGRQQLPALMTTEGQLQELGHPISDGHSASLLHQLNPSCKGKMFRVQLLWKAKILKKKGKSDSKYAKYP